MNELMNVGCEKPMDCRPESMSERLERRRANAQAELDRIKAAIKALEENPKVAEVIDLVIKASR